MTTMAIIELALFGVAVLVVVGGFVWLVLLADSFKR